MPVYSRTSSSLPRAEAKMESDLEKLLQEYPELFRVEGGGKVRIFYGKKSLKLTDTARKH